MFGKVAYVVYYLSIKALITFLDGGGQKFLSMKDQEQVFTYSFICFNCKNKHKNV